MAVKLLGKKWRAVAEIVGTKDHLQCLDHNKALVKKIRKNPDVEEADMIEIL